jgi:hypothetical protein
VTRKHRGRLASSVCGETVAAALIAARPGGLHSVGLATATGMSPYHVGVGVLYVKEHLARANLTPLTYTYRDGFCLSEVAGDWVVYEKAAFATELTRVERLISATVSPHAAKLPEDEYAAVVLDNLRAVRTSIRNLLTEMGEKVEALRPPMGVRARLTASLCGAQVQGALLEARPAGMRLKQLVAATDLTEHQVRRGVLYIREVLALEGRTPLTYTQRDGYCFSHEVLDWIVFEKKAFATQLRRIERLISGTVEPHAGAMPGDPVAERILDNVFAVRTSIRNLLREVEVTRR